MRYDIFMQIQDLKIWYIDQKILEKLILYYNVVYILIAVDYSNWLTISITAKENAFLLENIVYWSVVL